MAQDLGEPRSAHILTTGMAALIVVSNTDEVATRPQRMTGLHGFTTWLGIIWGIMVIFLEITRLMQEPR